MISSVLSSFPKGIKREQSVCQEVCYIYSAHPPWQDMGEKKMMWFTRSNAQLERQAEKKAPQEPTAELN